VQVCWAVPTLWGANSPPTARADPEAPTQPHAKQRPSCGWLPHTAPSQLGDQPLLLGQPVAFVLCNTRARCPQTWRARTKHRIPRSVGGGRITPEGFRGKTTCAGRKAGWARGVEMENRSQ